ncbi:EF-hand domain-containing protein [Arcobacter sp. LA11]|uniref:EF-hand domain-containing protein n=1 Tax=Arcobacter sp. LA11 TaxID=1898176 RepID=UPI00093276B0|nr:EF-hand domain-containing protein [Arcobacter sp. LA11]
MNSIEMSSMASLVMPTSTSMASHMISKKDSDSDSSLSIEEMGISEDSFSSFDLDSDGLINQSELTSAIDSKMSEFNGEMPSKEEFQSILSSFGFDGPSTNNTLSSYARETISSVLSNYDADNLTESDAQSIVAAFKEAGIQPSSELASAMEEAGFDAHEVGTLAGVGAAQGGTPPPPPSGSGGTSSSESEEEFDVLDTNEDGVVSLSELEEAYGTSQSDTSELSSNQQNALDNLSVLMDMLKSNSENEESSIDSKSFDGLLKAINNQNSNSEINSYLQNSNTSSLFSYA